ncbi:MAG: hypothetical protein KAI79_08070 [Bacteroidales bacterium]|nr:hypothetical protein [Bacteroidales bacterium]
MTRIHYDMLAVLAELSKEIFRHPEKKVEICNINTGSPMINANLADIAKGVMFYKIESSIRSKSMPDDYKKALTFAFKMIHKNDYFDANMVFTTHDRYRI